MMPVSLESTDYHDLRSKWFRVSHEPGLFVVEGTSDAVKHEIHKLRTHWQDKAIQIAVGDPYATLPLIYQLNPFQPIDDLVACKNALLRFQRSGWTPGNRKWVLVEVSSYLHPADLGAIHYILYRQKLRGVSVVLFFHRYPTMASNPEDIPKLPVSIVRDTPDQTRRLLEEHLQMVSKDKGKEKEAALALYNRLAWVLLSKSADPARYTSCFHFFDHNSLFQRLSATQQAVLWFELGQLLTKNGKQYTEARHCYSKAREIIAHDELTETYRTGKWAALDNGEALIEMQEGNVERAITLEQQAGQRIRQLPDGPDQQVFQIQTLLNIAGLQLRAGHYAEAGKTLLAAEKLCVDAYLDWLGHVLQLKMVLHQQLGEQEQEYELLIQLLRMKTNTIHSKLLGRAVEIAGALITQGLEERASRVYRLLMMGLPVASLPQIRLIRETLGRLGTLTPLDAYTQDQYIDKLESQLEGWEQLKSWNERRKSGWAIHS
ncbi:tetratricopeptide repeat protein [Paenibacillus sp. FSL R7-0026]|uniref:tetratricopeptide repeat protein n=1 Tax=Paenibacillus sp. FSL R7-0026 TaxID=2921668 RepID=UPI0030FA2379